MDKPKQVISANWSQNNTQAIDNPHHSLDLKRIVTFVVKLYFVICSMEYIEVAKYFPKLPRRPKTTDFVKL